MSEITTYQLQPTDLKHMRELMIVFGAAFVEHDTYNHALPSDDYLRRLLAKRDFIVLVGISDNKVVGGLTAYRLEKYEQELSEIYLYDLAVESAHRRKGVATALINHLKKVSMELDAYVAFVQADLGDDPAISLYTKLGKREEVLHFDIEIPKTLWPEKTFP